MNRKKACTECRQQKAKCDAYLNSGDACSRCKRVGLQCTISDPFKRENKRQRLSELERETDTLRKRLMTEDYRSSVIEPVQAERHDHSNMPSHPEASTARYYRVSSAASPSQGLGSVFLATPAPTTRTATLDGQALTTTSRTLDGVTVSHNDINGIFELYFREYSPYLPVLDSRLSPDVVHHQSPILFWVIIGTACRSYSQNPTLLSALKKGITNLALSSVITTGSPLQRVQAFLLLVTWPLPDAVETNQQEINYVFAGILLHLAQRSGLHVPAGSDEFFRATTPNLPDIGIARRTTLWAYIVLTYQRTCMSKGFLARTSFDISPEMSQSQSRQQTLSSALKLRLKWQDLCVQCGSAVSENGMRHLTPEQDRALSIIVRTYDLQIRDLEYTATDDSDRLECNIAQLYIRSFYFLKQDETSYATSFDKIQQVARQVIVRVDKLTLGVSNPVSIPSYIVNGLLFASYALLRILKSSIPFLSGESEEAKSSLFAAIGLLRSYSIDNNDMCSKSYTCLTTLWNSPRAFKKADGSDMLELRARSRLNGSHVVDAILWWREETDLHFRKQMQTLKNSALDPTDPLRSGALSGLTVDSEQQQSTMMDFRDTSLFDFDYFMGGDLSVPQDLLNFPGLDTMEPSNT
ncbi:hypothetical protein KCU79_g12327, partial [Aureobasidium melanogenum]